jgi:hypothetical protein
MARVIGNVMQTISLGPHHANVPNGIERSFVRWIVPQQATDTFWVNLIGRGYPAPNQRFRWCTDVRRADYRDLRQRR